ncbi:N-acetyltransferase [Reticulibacter mediterranei]|uniref:N-acetyltransferase n=1 Tax=Reticulibacter mediterranei TaxID=2778369 RepID=A0A8J3IQ15_9CHLR|nr:GNAT family N-acetyltransferase [Reticulibacter mediterranei]GHO94755.1 N-acetyltransferase [Reticulibacter mediterranei]
MPAFSIRPLTSHDRIWILQFISEQWGSNIIISRGTFYTADALPGFIAVEDGKRVGLITYHIQGNECEVVSVDSTRPGKGIGTALIDAVRQEAQRTGCKRLWLITTNDNLTALRFYQRHGFVLVAVHRNAIDEVSRKLKPQIPLIGEHGIPIRDEIELEMPLNNGERKVSLS